MILCRGHNESFIYSKYKIIGILRGHFSNCTASFLSVKENYPLWLKYLLNLRKITNKIVIITYFFLLRIVDKPISTRFSINDHFFFFIYNFKPIFLISHSIVQCFNHVLIIKFYLSIFKLFERTFSNFHYVHLNINLKYFDSL